MYVAIDDTYGPVKSRPSRYVTGNRRTYVGVVFTDEEAEEVRQNIRSCLSALPSLIGVAPSVFHFADIYNRKGIWADVQEGYNLRIFELFASIYQTYRWRVHVQTVDDRTLLNHNFAAMGVVDGIDLRTRDGTALMLLLLKVREEALPYPEKLVVRIDEGNHPRGVAFAKKVFSEWRDRYDGSYVSSVDEPLIQIADFMAFCINRSTHLGMKEARTKIDVWFLNLVGHMEINSPDMQRVVTTVDFSVSDFDNFHLEDRRRKGLE